MSFDTTQSQPLVSVIVPTYNYARFVGEMLESLQAQTYAHWECIVVDDDSTDDTREVVARYAAGDARITYAHQRNALQAAAKNTGLRRASGEYVQFLDADDLIEPRKFEHQVAYLQSHAEVDIVYGGVRYFRTNASERFYSMDEHNQPWMPEISGAGREMIEALLRANIMVINSPLVRRRIVERVGLFQDALPPAEDWDYWLRCALAGARFEFADLAGTLALVRGHSVSSSRNRIRMYRSMLLMRERLEPLITDAELRRLNREMMSVEKGCLGTEEAVSGSRLRAVGHLLAAAWGERRRNWRAKWLLCALCAPFLSESRFKALVAAPVKQTLAGLWR